MVHGMGGKFEDGFKVAFITAAAAYAYSASTNYENEASWKRGDGNPSMLDKDGNTIQGMYDETKGKIPWDKNVFGDNANMADGGTMTQGNLGSRIGNWLPGGAPISRVHDALLHPLYGGVPQNALTNWGSMPLAAALTYTALAADYAYLHPATNNLNKAY